MSSMSHIRGSSQAPANTTEIKYKMAKMRKITNWKLGMDDKLVMFWWIVERIASNGMHATWVEGRIRESQQIKKGTLNFKCTAWCTITYLMLCLTTSDDVRSLFWAMMIEGFTLDYAFNIGEFLD